jgi:hypothetical protein
MLPFQHYANPSLIREALPFLFMLYLCYRVNVDRPPQEDHGDERMTSTYRAMQITRPGHLELVERPVPQPQAGEVLIAVEACGICGADASDIENADPALRRVPGHEIVGRIVALGTNVPSIWSTGQRAPGRRVYMVEDGRLRRRSGRDRHRSRCPVRWFLDGRDAEPPHRWSGNRRTVGERRIGRFSAFLRKSRPTASGPAAAGSLFVILSVNQGRGEMRWDIAGCTFC